MASPRCLDLGRFKFSTTMAACSDSNMLCIHSRLKETQRSPVSYPCVIDWYYKAKSHYPHLLSPLSVIPASHHSPPLPSSLLVDVPHHSCFRHSAISIKNAGSFMNSSEWSWTVRGGRQAGGQQGETLAVGTDGGKREREGKEEQSEGGVAVLLNFNEYQGEFLLHFFFFFFLLDPFPFFFFSSWDVPIFYIALNHCHTNEL